MRVESWEPDSLLILTALTFVWGAARIVPALLMIGAVLDLFTMVAECRR